MRCQPLRRALTGKMEMSKASEQKEFANVSLCVIHGFYQLSGVSESARRCIRNIANAIKN
ncbi:hypothetical protein HPY06_16030 [Vibrio cholerae]|nr:hypothetical protein HPY06_16030 [Vibrio cholerae]